MDRITPIENIYAPKAQRNSPAVRQLDREGYSFADLLKDQGRAKSNDNRQASPANLDPAFKITETVPTPANLNGQFIDMLS